MTPHGDGQSWPTTRVDPVGGSYSDLSFPLDEALSRSVVPRFITAVVEGRRPIINGTGDISRDFVYVGDVVEANLLAARASSPSALTCNIASGSRTSLRELLQAVCVAAGRDVAPVFGPARLGDIQHSQADISLARQALRYAVSVPLNEGIARTLEWFRDRPATSKGVGDHQ